MINLDGFNDKQKEAVLYNDGPLLILAGAGSGKTKVLTTKVAKLIDDGVDVTEILAITFTNKASKEMKERIINLVGPKGYYIQISTFHSFGLKILKDNYNVLGYEKNFTILDSDDSLSVIKKIMKEENIDSKKITPKYIRNSISNAKNALVSENEYIKYANTNEELIVEKVYKIYQKKLKINNCVDFDDLLVLPIKLFTEFKTVLKVYQERYKYILIDEYQDTNEAQYLLAKMISAKYKNICVVGDNDQSIYSFRGANYQNILNFEKDYDNAKVIMLEQNYRSTKVILNSANSVIKNNKYRKNKNLWCDNNEGDLISYYRALDEKDEADFVTSEIEKLVNNNESLNEIAVIYRTNAQSRVLEESFLKQNIPYKVVGSFYFYNRKEIKDLISYLKLLYNNHDDISLIRVINVPKRGIGVKTIEKLEKVANTQNKSLYETISSGKELQFKNIIEEIKKDMDNITLTQLIDLILDKTGIRSELENENSIEADARLENLEEFKSITKNFEESSGTVSLEDFLNEITLVSDIEEHKDNNNKVTLMTMHASKGLEFNNVFIAGMEDGIFPSFKSFYQEKELEEERRLCYVAITRAKKRLYIINACSRRLFGNDTSNPPSRFIKEMGTENIKKIDGNSLNKINNFNKVLENNNITNDVNFKVGDKIIQDIYGKGIIVSINDSIMSVAFPHPIGIKKFIKNHKSIHLEE